MKDTIKKESVETEDAEPPSIKHIQISDHVIEMVYYQGKITFRLSGNVNVNELSVAKKEELLKHIRKLQDDGTIYRLFGLPPQNTQLLPPTSSTIPSSTSPYLSRNPSSAPLGRPSLQRLQASAPIRVSSSSSLSPAMAPPSTTNYNTTKLDIMIPPPTNPHTGYMPAKKTVISSMSPHESVIMNLSGIEVAHGLTVQME